MNIRNYVYTGIENTCGFVKGKVYLVQTKFNEELNCIEVNSDNPKATAYFSPIAFVHYWQPWSRCI